MATDPVCGMQVDERTAASSSVFEGSHYYFCSTGCKAKFDSNPSAYIDTPPAGMGKRPEPAHPHAQPLLLTLTVLVSAPGPNAPLLGESTMPQPDPYWAMLRISPPTLMTPARTEEPKFFVKE